MKVILKRYQKPVMKVKKLNLSLFLSKSSSYFDSEWGYTTLLAQACSSTYSCFLPDTKILMSDYKLKDIHDLEVGDLIQTFNLKLGKREVDEVTNVLLHAGSIDNYLSINEKVKVTGNHYLWINNSSWGRADTLKQGDSLLDQDGREVKVQSLKKVPSKSLVLNIHLVGGNHNYFANNTLAHNAKC